MITKAYYKFQNAMRKLRLRNVTSSSDRFYATLTDVIDTSGNEAKVSDGMITYTTDWNSAEQELYNANANSEVVTNVVPSTSDGANFSPNDYTIANPISNVVQLGCLESVAETENGFQKHYVANFSNSNSEAITIKSVGLVHSHLYKSAINEGASYTNILFAEVVLDTPLVVPAGTGFIITVIWNDNRQTD